MSRYTEPTAMDWVRVVAALLLFMAFLVAGAVLLPEYILVILIAGLALLIYWHCRSFAYRCVKCRHKFEISVLHNLVTPHFFWIKYTRCPACRQWGWSRILRIEREKFKNKG